MWYLVGNLEEFPAADARGFGRLHVLVGERAITIFITRSGLTAIDSVCAHAGGDLTHGSVVEIEELGVSAVACPLHRYLYAVSPQEKCGANVYQALDFIDGKPTPGVWTATTKPQSAQRSHKVVERGGKIYLELNEDEAAFASDQSASNGLCTRAFEFHDSPVPQPDFEL